MDIKQLSEELAGKTIESITATGELSHRKVFLNLTDGNVVTMSSFSDTGGMASHGITLRYSPQAKKESPLEVPDMLRQHSLDEVAETVAGITTDTYKELWTILSEAENPKPLGGDGSNGTTEEPIISDGQYGSDLVSGWSHLSRKAQENIIAAAINLEGGW